jgi:hypothetical protein
VAARHKVDVGGGTIATAFTAPELADLLAFVRSIDDATPALPNATDLFIQ